jgi:hypothetical protein
LVPLGIPTMNLHQTQELNDIDYHRVLFAIIRVGFYQKKICPFLEQGTCIGQSFH